MRARQPSLATVVAVVAATALLLAPTPAEASPKPPRVIEPANPDDPPRLPGGRPPPRVLVAGAGLAGLSAALELAERGFEVVVREKEAYVGGRLHSVPVKVDVPHAEEPFMIEHGFHAWFHNYWNFKDIRSRLGIDSNFRPWGAVHYVFKDYKPEQLISKGPYPLNMLGIIERSPNLHLTDAIKSLLMLPDLVNYDYDTVYEAYDNITFVEWGQLRKVSKPFFDIVFSPTLSVTLNERQVMSAAEMLTYQQLYFLSDPRADRREVATEDYYTAVLGPWVRHLQEHKVEIRLDDPVKSLHFSCSTAGCAAGATATDDAGGRYDAVVVATDMAGVQAILNVSSSDSEGRAALAEVRGIVNQVPLAPLYKVARVWFDKQLVRACETAAGCPDIMETPDFTPVNLVAQYHLLERQSAAWANKTGGSIFEFHCYTWTFGDLPDKQVWQAIAPAVHQVYPEIADDAWEVLAVHVNSYQNFPSFARGSNLHRPGADLAKRRGLGGLHFAGDWLRPGYPSALMERAVSTGREAANAILLDHRVRQVPLTVTSSLGPGFLEEVKAEEAVLLT